MQILHVCNRFPPAMGGAERYIETQTRILKKLGHDIPIYTTDMKDDNSRLSRDECTHDNPNIRRCNVFAGNPLSYYFAPSMIPALSKIKPDIFHAHSFGYFPADVGISIMHRKNVPTLWTLHGIFERTTPFRRVIGNIYNIMASQTTFKKADKIIAISRGEKEQIMNMFKVPEEKIEVIWNGVDIENFKRRNASKFKKNHGLNESDIIIGLVGRINKVKGIDILIRSMKYITKQHPKAKLLIAGPDFGFLRECKELVTIMNLQNNVIFTGPCTGDTLLETYSSIDIFVAPSRWEPFGNVLAEAMAMELPVISTYTPGPMDIVEENKTGYLVNLNEKDLAEKINILISDASLRKKFGTNGRKRVERDFTWDKNVASVLKVYEQLLV